MSDATPDNTSSQPRPNTALIAVAALLALIALAVSAYLSVQSLTGGAVAGCGGDEGCGAVLASPWSSVYGIPVSLLGSATYLAVLLGLALRLTSKGTNKLGDFLLLATAPAMLIAAGWYTYIQLVEIQAICPYCMVDHGIGVVLAVLLPLLVFGKSLLNPIAPLAVGIVGTLILIAVQFSAPANQDTASTENPFADRDGDTVIDGKRFVSLFGGALQFNLEDEPYLGDPKAEQVVALIFDYACPHCRAMHVLVEEAIEQDPSAFAVVPIAITIDTTNNPHISSDNERFADSYERAKLALAVHAIDREKWLAFDKWMFSPQTIVDFPRSAEEARAKAIALVGEDALNAQLAGDALAKHEATIKRNIDLMALLPDDSRYIPVVTTPGAPRHLTERFYDVAVLKELLKEAKAGLETAAQAPAE